MGNDVYTYILLEGESKQKDHFINHHKKYHQELELNIWDCEPFLKEKNPTFFDTKKEYTKTGGRFKQGQNSDNIDFISLESKYGLVEESIKELSKFYDNLTIKLDYRDEDYEMGIGWIVIKNGTLLGEDYLSISKLLTYNCIVNNIITINGKNDDINNFIFEIKKEYEINTISNNEVEFPTYDTPCYDWFMDKKDKYNNLRLKLVYRESRDKYYGYVILENGTSICDNFINLETESQHGIIDYFKYNSLNDYLTNNNSL